MFGLGNSAVHRLHKTWEVRGAAAPHQLVTLTVFIVFSPSSQTLLAENPQQDKENLLRLREADGKRPRLDSGSECFYCIFNIFGDVQRLFPAVVGSDTQPQGLQTGCGQAEPALHPLHASAAQR